ncbi:MAG: YerC/YecD family TrpR-related protein [Alphaproteobacteria bacterium]|nr:YerC/YecD family TrpR-related protein [Alphaproteobacteria bacterium]
MKSKLAKNSSKGRSDIDSLYDAFLQLKTREECRRFLLDLCTPAEITAFAERWCAARLLKEGKLSYREIHAATGISVTTITRVARFLSQEPHQGYALILKKLGYDK